jgi:hypothetical protein
MRPAANFSAVRKDRYRAVPIAQVRPTIQVPSPKRLLFGAWKSRASRKSLQACDHVTSLKLRRMLAATRRQRRLFAAVAGAALGSAGIGMKIQSE